MNKEQQINVAIIEEKIKPNMEKNEPLEICVAIGNELARLPFKKDVVSCLRLFLESKTLDNMVYFTLHCGDASTSVEKLDVEFLDELEFNHHLLPWDKDVVSVKII